jgi:hypothetical protein
MAEKLEQDGFCIPIAVITRWNSQYYTVARTIDIPSEKLNAYLKESKKDSLILSQRDIAILNEFVSLFALIAEVCTKAQADQAASVSLVAPSLLEINFDLQAEQTSLKYTGSLCKALLKSMQNRFGGLLQQFELGMGDAQKPRSTCELYSDSIFLLTPFLDARFGFRWIVHSKLPEEVKIRLCEEIKRLVVSAALQMSGANSSSTLDIIHESTADPAGGTTTPTSKRKSLFAFPRGQETWAKRTRPNVVERIEEEVLLFSREASDDCGLIFKKASVYPYLNVLALRLLCVPASSAPVERVFSTSGFIMRPHRSSMSKDLLAKLTFLKVNSDLLH